MIGRTILMAGVVALAAAAAPAQDPRVELGGTAGWTFSDGVNVGSIDDSPITVGPKDAFSWGTTTSPTTSASPTPRCARISWAASA